MQIAAVARFQDYKIKIEIGAALMKILMKIVRLTVLMRKRFDIVLCSLFDPRKGINMISSCIPPSHAAGSERQRTSSTIPVSSCRGRRPASDVYGTLAKTA